MKNRTLCVSKLGVKKRRLSQLRVCLQSAKRVDNSGREKRRRSLFICAFLFSPASSLAPLLRQNYSRHRTEWPPRSPAWPENERQGKEAPFVREEDRREREQKKQSLESSSSSSSGTFFGSRTRAELVPATAAAAAATAASLYSSSISSSSSETTTENDGRGEKRKRERERWRNEASSTTTSRCPPAPLQKSLPLTPPFFLPNAASFPPPDPLTYTGPRVRQAQQVRRD